MPADVRDRIQIGASTSTMNAYHSSCTYIRHLQPSSRPFGIDPQMRLLSLLYLQDLYFGSMYSGKTSKPSLVNMNVGTEVRAEVEGGGEGARWTDCSVIGVEALFVVLQPEEQSPNR